MGPISNNENNVFSRDYQSFVLQDLMKQTPPQMVESQKKFDLAETDKSQKSKKDSEKQKEKKKRPFNFD